MSIEHLQENERKIREKTEEERKLEISETLQDRMEKERLFEIFEKDKKLAFLKSMIERGLIDSAEAENIMSGEILEIPELQEILDKIDETEALPRIDKILPKEHRVTKEEYIAALGNDELRLALLYKIDRALTYIYDSLYPDTFSVVHFFGDIFSTLSKSLVKAQENLIDIKNSLQKKKI